MSKITFRADDDLVDRLEACDASKSEVMREALRTYLDGNAAASDGANGSVDDALAERVDELIADRLDAALDERLGPAAGTATPAHPSEPAGDINVNVTLDAPSAESGNPKDEVRVTRETAGDAEPTPRKTEGAQAEESTCSGCGDIVPSDHVYCPNCGEKQSHRAFCECGDELRTDWAFCPGCGRRTTAADVLNDR